MENNYKTKVSISLFIITLAYTIGQVVSISCPAHPDCPVCTATKYYCQVTSTTNNYTCPKDVPSSVVHLTMVNTPVGCGKMIMNRIFKLPKLEVLMFIKVPIEYVYPKAFSNCPSLRVVVIKDTKLKKLMKGSFDGLTQLQAIDLSSNGLVSTNFKSGLFSTLTSLTDLNLNKNMLSLLDSGLLSGLNSLEELKVAENRLVSLNKGVFGSIQHLRLIHLYRNDIRKVDTGVFTNLSALETLDIGENKIPSLDADVFRGTPLTNLSLVDNWLTSFPTKALQAIGHNMDAVYLDKNKISKLDNGALNGIRIRNLSLSNNQLTTVTAGAFMGSYIESLDLQNNKLTSLPEDVGASLNPNGNIYALGNTAFICSTCTAFWLAEFLDKHPDSTSPMCSAGFSLVYAYQTLLARCITTTTKRATSITPSASTPILNTKTSSIHSTNRVFNTKIRTTIFSKSFVSSRYTTLGNTVIYLSPTPTKSTKSIGKSKKLKSSFYTYSKPTTLNSQANTGGSNAIHTSPIATKSSKIGNINSNTIRAIPTPGTNKTTNTNNSTTTQTGTQTKYVSIIVSSGRRNRITPGVSIKNTEIFSRNTVHRRTSSNSKLSGALIGGVVVGSIALVSAVGIAVLFIVKKKAKVGDNSANHENRPRDGFK